MMGLTATATERVRQDILQQLRLRDPLVHVASFNRHNLFYDVRPKGREAYQDLLKQVQQHSGSGIIYCLSRARWMNWPAAGPGWRIGAALPRWPQ
jgi:ATP-dependent DNA helicase RecQ